MTANKSLQATRDGAFSSASRFTLAMRYEPLGPFHVMRITFGILSFCAAGLLAFWLVPVVDQIALPYLLRDQSVGFPLMRLGPIHLYEPQICILAAVVALLFIALIVAGIYAFTSRDTTA